MAWDMPLVLTQTPAPRMVDPSRCRGWGPIGLLSAAGWVLIVLSAGGIVICLDHREGR